jgi:hypothetical protein
VFITDPARSVLQQCFVNCKWESIVKKGLEREGQNLFVKSLGMT